MKRALILIAPVLVIAALPLAGCSGKAKAPDAKAAAAGQSKHNPWSVEGAGDGAADPKANAKPAASKAPAKGTAGGDNPWAKEPPPGTQPSGAAATTAKPKAK